MTSFRNIRSESIPTVASAAERALLFPPTDGYAVVQLDTDGVYIWNQSSQTWIAAGGGGGGAVNSVNGQTGTVIVNAINQLTGDGTAGPVSQSASAALTLATVNSNVGSFGSATAVPAITVNGKGLITAVTSTPIQITESQVTNLTTDLSAKAPIASPTFTGTVTTPALNLSGQTATTVPYLDASKNLLSSAVTPTELGYVSGVTSSIQTQLNSKQASGNYIISLTGDVTGSGPGATTTTLATVNINVGSFGSASSSSAITVNGKGLITAAVDTPILITESQVTNLVSDLAGKQPTGNYILRSINSVSTSTAAGSVANTDYIYLVSGVSTITLPTAITNTNRYTIKNVGTSTVSIATTSSQTIDGSVSPILITVQNVSLELASDGSNWNII